jgi:16S rRNA (adenine1518-N6/adenine1519-N6)-dimethyltransferase
MSKFAKKHFGQNFLVDDTIIQAILSSLNALPNQNFIEIGPGKGALTKPMLANDLNLSVIEIDRDLIATLEQLKNKHPKFTVYCQDALNFDFNRNGDKYWRVIGNLPYNISSPLLLHCFTEINSILDMHFMLQNEVVDRLCAQPNSKAYGRLSVITQYYCTVEKLFEVSPSCFSPQPKVTSAFFRLSPKPKRIELEIKNLELVTQLAFGQRRKTLRNSLAKLFSAEQLTKLNIDATRRAETLSLEEFCLLAQHVEG